MRRNLGETGLPRRRRARDPMREFDALPPALRRWLAEAALPWSPLSCRRIWARVRAAGGGEAGVIARLEAAQAAMLGRDRAA